MHSSHQSAAVLLGADPSFVGAGFHRDHPQPADGVGIADSLSRAHGLKAAGKSGVKRWAKHHTRKDPSALIDQLFAALAEQTVTVPGAATVELFIPRGGRPDQGTRGSTWPGRQRSGSDG